MKTLTLVLISFALLGCNQTKEDLVASKCRLKLPIVKAQCEAVGVYGTKGGRMQGLPVTNLEDKE